VPTDERVERLEDQVQLLRAAWSAGPLEYDATFHDVTPEVNVTPKPDGTVPVMLGGAAKPAVRRAARTAEGWCAPSKLSLSGIEKRVEDIHSVRDEEGLDGEFTVYALVHGWVGDSREAAWEAMRPGYFYLQRRYAEIFSGESVEELGAERKRELKEEAIFGTPEQVAAELERYRAAAGDDVHVVFRTYHPGVGTDAMVECIDRLGSEVAPMVR
jgi:alkanesulfonate monooxygenase SsuD/methylene tetrahydromethanopterin reductase-like flavin-dependent oxidoreductase (luciferase family)